MQLLLVTPGFWLVKVNIDPLESLSVSVTVPAEKVSPALLVVPERAAQVPPPATDHRPSTTAMLNANLSAVAGRCRPRRRPGLPDRPRRRSARPPPADASASAGNGRRPSDRCRACREVTAVPPSWGASVRGAGGRRAGPRGDRGGPARRRVGRRSRQALSACQV